MVFSVEEKLEKIINEISVIRIDELGDVDNYSLSQDLSFDSLQMIKLIVSIEEEFGIEIEDEYLDFEILDNYLNLKNYILSKLN